MRTIVITHNGVRHTITYMISVGGEVSVVDSSCSKELAERLLKKEIKKWTMENYIEYWKNVLA